MSNKMTLSLFQILATSAMSGGAILVAACSSGASPEPQGTVMTDKAQTGTQGLTASKLTAFELTRPARSTASMSQWGALLIGLVKGAPVAPADVGTLAAPKGAPGALDVVSVTDPQVKLSYRTDNDVYVVTNEAVTGDHAAAGDIGMDGARSLFMSTMGSAVSAGIVSATGLLASKARMSRVVQGEGGIGQTPIEKTAEYVFTAPRMINEIELFDAGLQVSVHRNGKIARVKVFGPMVASALDVTGREVPTGKGYTFVAAVQAPDITTRVQAEHPRAIIKPLGVQYWLPPGQASAVTEPKQMYFVVPTATVGGQQVEGRGFYVAYSLSASGAPATVWPLATLNPVGNGKK